MLPVTHVLYLASGLLVLGLLTAVLRRAPGRALLGLVLALSAGGLVWAAFARAWGHGGGQVVAALVVAVAAAYAAVGAALVRARGA
jgi:NADH:ubiquinone oxidoreductase subunit K